MLPPAVSYLFCLLSFFYVSSNLATLVMTRLLRMERDVSKKLPPTANYRIPLLSHTIAFARGGSSLASVLL